MNHIAILTDSCADVPQHILEKYDNIFVVPLIVNYSYGQFRDKIDIQPDEIYQNFEKEIPKTSLPSGEEISKYMKSMVDAGYTDVLVVTISSGLSGTFNFMKIVSAEFSELNFKFIDTKNIGIGAGIAVVHAAELIEAGMAFDQVAENVLAVTKRTSVYFCVKTLEYLRKGGRIGLVSSTLGTMLGIIPIISCSKEGVYYTVKKLRGRQKALTEAWNMVVEKAKSAKKYRIAIAHGGAAQEAAQLLEMMKQALPVNCEIYTGQISPALVVHTGPGLIGVGIQVIEN